MTATATKTDHRPTRAQIVRLYSLAHLAGLDRDGVHAEIWERYGADSTRQLAPRQYEQYGRDLELRARARSRAVEQTAAERVMHFPKVHDRAGCERILRETWPKLVSGNPTLAGKLVEVLDYCRLHRLAATMSPRLIEVEIQRWQKLPLNILDQAAEKYLNSYTSKNERYFFGICRRLVNEAKRDQRIADAQARRNAEMDRAVEKAVQAVVMAAGPRPAPTVILSETKDPAVCCCSRARLSHHRDGAYRPIQIPCPWCDAGRDLLRRALHDPHLAENLAGINWGEVRDEVMERLDEEAALQGDPEQGRGAAAAVAHASSVPETDRVH